MEKDFKEALEKEAEMYASQFKTSESSEGLELIKLHCLHIGEWAYTYLSQTSKEAPKELVEALDACFGVMMQPTLEDKPQSDNVLLREGNLKFYVPYHHNHFIEARAKAEKMYYEAKAALKEAEALPPEKAANHNPNTHNLYIVHQSVCPDCGGTMLMNAPSPVEETKKPEPEQKAGLRWVKASESIDRLPMEKFLHLRDNVGIERLGNFFEEDGEIKCSICSNGAHESFVIPQKSLWSIEWLEEAATLPEGEAVESDAVAFAEWVLKDEWYAESGFWYESPITNSSRKLTSEQLYKLFKQKA
jgi:hypothetical protein